jgi:hypothetical protein
MTNTTATARGSLRSMPGSKTMVVGAIGAGKTHCIRTLLDAGITPFILFTEPGMRTVADIPSDQLHWMYLPPAQVTWDDLYDNAKKINTMSIKMLANLSDMNKSKYGQFLTLLAAMNNFTCDRTGESFGNVADWQTDRAIVIDSLSGLNIMAMDMVIGGKPMKSVADWGIAMDNLDRFITTMVMNTQCHFVLTSHLEREQDELTGATHLMPATLGKKLAPKIPRFFDDVILCNNKEDKFSWSTSGINISLKHRNLPAGLELPPSFKPLIDSWVEAGGIIQPTEKKE